MEIDDLMNKIFNAISDFVDKNGKCQTSITLPESDYLIMESYALSNWLSREWWQNGPKFCQLDVFRGGDSIVIG